MLGNLVGTFSLSVLLGLQLGCSDGEGTINKLTSVHQKAYGDCSGGHHRLSKIVKVPYLVVKRYQLGLVETGCNGSVHWQLERATTA